MLELHIQSSLSQRAKVSSSWRLGNNASEHHKGRCQGDAALQIRTGALKGGSALDIEGVCGDFRDLSPYILDLTQTLDLRYFTSLRSKVCGEQLVSFECLWPHAFFATLYHEYKEHFFSYVVPSLDRLREFWRTQKGCCLIILRPM